MKLYKPGCKGASHPPCPSTSMLIVTSPILQSAIRNHGCAVGAPVGSSVAGGALSALGVVGGEGRGAGVCVGNSGVDIGEAGGAVGGSAVGEAGAGSVGLGNGVGVSG